jgi:hypothetical protein
MRSAPVLASPSTSITPGGTPSCAPQIARAGRERRILAHHICDWLVPTRDLLLDRGMMGDGVIDLKQFRAISSRPVSTGRRRSKSFPRELVAAAGRRSHRHLHRAFSNRMLMLEHQEGLHELRIA